MLQTEPRTRRAGWRPAPDAVLPAAWDNAIDSFRKALIDGDRSPKTVRVYCQAVRRLCLFLHDSGNPAPTPASVVPGDLTTFLLRDVRDDDRGPETNSRHDRRHRARRALETTALQQFYEHLRRQGLSPYPFEEKPQFPQRRRKANRPIRHLTAPELLAFFEAVQADTVKEPYRGQRDRTLFGFLVATGLRIEEAVNLRRDVLTGALISGELAFIGKGDKERRIEITRTQAAVIEECLAARDACPYKNVPKDVVWATRRGAMTAGAVQRAALRYGKRAGVRRVTPHVFRHTFATGMADRGVAIEVVQSLMGHESIETTRIYVTESREARIAAMEGAWRPPPPKP